VKSPGPKYSPMLEQYFGMKAKHPEAILLSRVGDFYEAYGEDAEIVARALQIALTSKEAGGGKRVAMAGVPHHALAQYLARLVQQRFVVALAEQLEIPQPNRLVRRDVVRLPSPPPLRAGVRRVHAHRRHDQEDDSLRVPGDARRDEDRDRITDHRLCAAPAE